MQQIDAAAIVAATLPTAHRLSLLKSGRAKYSLARSEIMATKSPKVQSALESHTHTHTYISAYIKSGTKNMQRKHIKEIVTRYIK